MKASTILIWFGSNLRKILKFTGSYYQVLKKKKFTKKSHEIINVMAVTLELGVNKLEEKNSDRERKIYQKGFDQGFC